MATPKFNQAMHTLKLISDQNPSDDDILKLHDGYLTDLVRAIKLGTVPSRGKFHQAVGLDTFSLFFVTRSGLWVSDDFRDSVVAKANPDVSHAVATKTLDLSRSRSDASIQEMLGNNHLFTESQVCGTIAQMISGQEGGQVGKLLNNGRTNVFYLDSCVVFVRWNSSFRSWNVHTCERACCGWDAGCRVFSPATE
jgi:hypothetical protein